MTLQGDPQPHNPLATELPLRLRRSAPANFKALVVAGIMIAAIAMTPPLPDPGPPQPSNSSIALESRPFERRAAPAVVSPPAEPPVPADAATAQEPEVDPAEAAVPAEAPAEQPPAAAPEPPAAVVVPPAEAAPRPAINEPQPAQPGWTIYVAGTGGQDVVDACIGPVHYTPTDAFSLFITEHDYCGGWARFSSINVGQTVTLAGYGSYTVTARGQVPLGGTTSHVSAVFGGFPRAVLQTCIPGTSQMLVIALN
ncbi:peptidoglycan-binding protein [Paenarthrobacter aurescens]|uniref:peptidoglycan-binding protein n=1 Tax=Paenarthrobacter aurescens TaxID=43663 RepID=UPI0021C23CCF|nr:peptidoglycan-binding protein [Paenarthrobacter aurescens]MCT9869284.1 peptidoglycan-binding protein [Paenarthrobacter aurescens]